MVAVVDAQFDSTAPSILTTCIFSSSTSFCSCSSFFISSTICCSFSCSRMSFSWGIWKDWKVGVQLEVTMCVSNDGVSGFPPSWWSGGGRRGLAGLLAYGWRASCLDEEQTVRRRKMEELETP
ncbi:hypothetical protein F7725_014005 [Dissostichus mawsoni]|uniref:Uncharacterized protein n=1 Tax=Dissostichus mawsoni TaxID=36200 RepID=A0A7J5YXU8_DISMA|nr:hypothetical protein F7725_014005 [Dissostichus mawsoni]